MEKGMGIGMEIGTCIGMVIRRGIGMAIEMWIHIYGYLVKNMNGRNGDQRNGHWNGYRQ